MLPSKPAHFEPAEQVLESLAAEAELEDVDALSIASWQPLQSIESGALALEDGEEWVHF